MSIILALKTDTSSPVRRGSAFMWSVVRDLTEKDRSRTFSTAEVLARTTRTETSTVRKWLKGLICAGILEELPDGVFRCLRRPVLLPHISGDGKVVRSGQDALWNAIRGLGIFSAREVALLASTEEAPVGGHAQPAVLAARIDILQPVVDMLLELGSRKSHREGFGVITPEAIRKAAPLLNRLAISNRMPDEARKLRPYLMLESADDAFHMPLLVGAVGV